MGPFVYSISALICLTVVAVFWIKKSFFKYRKPHQYFTDSSTAYDHSLMVKDPQISIEKNRKKFRSVAGLISMLSVIVFVQYPSAKEKMEERLDPKLAASEMMDVVVTEREQPKKRKRLQKSRTLKPDTVMLEDTSDLKDLLSTYEGAFDIDSTEDPDEGSEETYEPPTLTHPQVVAQFPGGLQNFQRWAVLNIKIPVADMRAGKRGMVMVSFVVYEDGSVQHVEVLKGVSPGIDQAVIQLLNKSPLWTPAQENGEVVRQKRQYPLFYKGVKKLKLPWRLLLKRNVKKMLPKS